MEDFKKFWTLVKKWQTDPIDKYSATDIIDYIDDYVENPQRTFDNLKNMNKEYEDEIKEIK